MDVRGAQQLPTWHALHTHGTLHMRVRTRVCGRPPSCAEEQGTGFSVRGRNTRAKTSLEDRPSQDIVTRKPESPQQKEERWADADGKQCAGEETDQAESEHPQQTRSTPEAIRKKMGMDRTAKSSRVRDGVSGAAVLHQWLCPEHVQNTRYLLMSRGTDLSSLGLSNQSVTAANTAMAVPCE